MKQSRLAVLCVVMTVVCTGRSWADEPPSPPDLPDPPSVEPLTAQEAERYRDLDSQPLRAFTNVDLADYLSLRPRVLAQEGKTPEAAEEIGHFALKAVETPFRLNAVRFDYAEADCVVFVERCIAMACATDWESYYRISQRLRHQDGQVEYRKRNFSTLGDWVPNNKDWLLRDVTADLPGATPFQHVIRPKVFEEYPAAPGSKFVRTVFKGHDWQSKDVRVCEDVYIPGNRIEDVVPHLKTGDVGCVIIGVSRNPGCDHMGLVHVSEIGEAMFVHGAPLKARIETLPEFVRRYPGRVNGFKFLRLRDNARDTASAEILRVADSTGSPPGSSVEDAKVVRLRDHRAR